MATPWPPAPDWPANHREHATKLSRYLQTAVTFIDTTNGITPRAASQRFEEVRDSIL
ncbi:hypothetical protein S7711_10284 [Stachybotrys chartarum IBT 7711]|uniref:Uncharacterized protein n=1 Tax=Stachybotrys chartarum (strain CBS 109288 / IBT 7711) TaxID=1280523 RepID=A0A084B348_STACB|nr:hypothetical protein S7711_10284 [Stachybotrys chartarum IBT 7711]